MYGIKINIEAFFGEVNLKIKKQYLHYCVKPHLNEIGKGLDSYLSNHDKILIIADFNSKINESSMHKFCNF